jgi:hypothetical protein
MEVANEQVLATIEDSCSTNAYLQRFAPLGNSVTELLAKFQKETTSILFRERDYPGCPEISFVTISYSPSGYPISADYHWDYASPWNLGPETYKGIYGTGPLISSCLGGVDIREPDIKVDLQPLP